MYTPWNPLEEFSRKVIKIFDKSCYRCLDEIEHFHQPENGWYNIVWKNDHIRRAHLDIVDARESKKLWMMHLCIFPNLKNDAPIFGYDVISGPKKVTGFFHDFSPVAKRPHFMQRYFEIQSSKYSYSKKRELPEWARNIFSESMISAGNVKDKKELNTLIDLVDANLHYYVNILPIFTLDKHNENDIMEAQDYYAENQRKNPHTPKVMKSLGLSEEDVNIFCNEVLFPKVKT